MATTVDYIEFVMDSIGEISGIEFRYKKMFGEYCVYANEKPVLLVCDNMVYVKKLACIEELMQGKLLKPPYNGAKDHYLLDMESREFTERLLLILEKNTPLPKPKKKKQ